MVANKHVSKVIIILMAAAVVFCLFAVACSDMLTEQLGGKTVSMEYESKLFDTTEFINIDIQMDQDEWNKMLSNAISEEYYKCDVVINGTKFSNVAIRPKGNTSLSAIAMDPDSERFSFKLEFGHYVDGQTCYGLDKLILNNNYADATNMKEAIVYDMYQFLDADASLYNFASISVNGEYRGVYLALEGVEQSFMLRTYGTQDGELYKPDNMEMGGGNERRGGRRESNDPNADKSTEKTDTSSVSDSNGKTDSDTSKTNDTYRSSGNRNSKGGPGGFSMGGSGGANLNYTDDNLGSYSSIWESSITVTGDADHRRVVTALKNISEGVDMEKYLDIDNILKYMAVHTFAVNMDSLSGSMAHNYYLYEYDGQLNIIPWDYNLSFGGMSMGSSGDATDMVNDAVDTPFAGTQFFDALLNNEEYLARYHTYLQQLTDEYVKGGRFDETYARIRDQIDTLVETDPTASYTYEEYKIAADLLYKTIELRAESIDGQINGTIPSTDAGQRKDSSAFVDASDIDVTLMGQFNMGGGGFGSFGRRSGSNSDSSSDPSNKTDNTTENPFGDPPEGGSMPDMSGFDPGNMPEGGSMPEMSGFDPGNMPEGRSMPDMSGFDSGNMPEGGNMPDMNGFDPGNMPDMGSFSPPGSGGTTNSSDGTGSNRQPPSFSGMPGRYDGQQTMMTLLTYGICLVVMLAALALAVRYKRR